MMYEYMLVVMLEVVHLTIIISSLTITDEDEDESDEDDDDDEIGK